MDHLVYDGLYSLNDVSRIDGRDQIPTNREILLGGISKDLWTFI